jgi:hypothetical protein
VKTFLYLPLPSFYPLIHADLEELRAHSKLKILQIEVKRGSDFSDYIEKTIDVVKKVYTKEDENPKITQLKYEFSKNVSTILTKFGTASIELTKRAAFRDLIRLYVAIDNADPETILGYYQAYQEKSNELYSKFKKEEERLNIFYEAFPRLDRKEYQQYLLNLKNIFNEGIKDAWEQFVVNIKQHYPTQLAQQASGSVAEDSEMMDGIVECTAVVQTLVEIPDEEMENSGVKPEKISSTPFWAVQPAQITENTAAERPVELAI